MTTLGRSLTFSGLTLAVSVALLTPFAHAQCQFEDPPYQTAHGTPGCGSGQFGRLYAIAFGATGKVFTVDTSPSVGCNRLSRYDRVSGEEQSTVVPGLDQNGDADIMVLGDTAYVAIRDGNTIIAFDTNTLSEIFRKPISVSLSNPRFLSFEPKSQTIIAGCDDGRSYVLERNLGEALDAGGMAVQIFVPGAVRGVATRDGEVWIGCTDQVIYRQRLIRLPNGRIDLTSLSSVNSPVRPFEIHFDTAGRLFIIPARTDGGAGDEIRGYSVTSTGVFTLRLCWGSYGPAPGAAPGAFDRITGFSASSAFGFAVADLENSRFQLFGWSTAAADPREQGKPEVSRLQTISARSTEIRLAATFAVEDPTSVGVFDILGRRVPVSTTIDSDSDTRSLLVIKPFTGSFAAGILLVRVESGALRAEGKVALLGEAGR